MRNRNCMLFLGLEMKMQTWNIHTAKIMSYQVFVSLVLHSFSFINKKIIHTQDSVSPHSQTLSSLSKYSTCHIFYCFWKCGKTQPLVFDTRIHFISQTWHSNSSKFASLQRWRPFCPNGMICRENYTLLAKQTHAVLYRYLFEMLRTKKNYLQTILIGRTTRSNTWGYTVQHVMATACNQHLNIQGESSLSFFALQ